MQTFVNIEASNSLKASRSSINENFESVASDFSGTMFPDVSLVVGMKCYRTDLGKVFRLTAINPPIWTEISDLNDSYVKSSVFNEVLEDYTKSASPSFNVPVIAPKFVGELDGNSKTVSALKSPFKLSLGGSVSSDISLVDGSNDVIVNVKDIKAESLKGTATIDVKGNVTGDLIGTASKATSDANGNNISDSFIAVNKSITDNKASLDDSLLSLVKYNSIPCREKFTYVDDWFNRDNWKPYYRYRLSYDCFLPCNVSCNFGSFSGDVWCNNGSSGPKSGDGNYYVLITISNLYQSKTFSFGYKSVSEGSPSMGEGSGGEGG